MNKENKARKFVKTLPTLPGCYLFKSEKQILYIGKAKNIRKRVSSYFSNYTNIAPKTQLMLDKTVRVDFFVVNSEMEALILEANLIGKHKPPYNVLLKNSSGYSWIKITKDDYPRIYRSRNRTDPKANYYGPFTSTEVRDQIYSFLRKQFPFRSCNYEITDKLLEKRLLDRENGKLVKNRLCTYYHIGQCEGPCEGLVDQTNYKKNISSIKKFLRNKKTTLLGELKDRMKKYASELEFEKAAKLKKQIDNLQFTPSGLKIKDGFYEDNVIHLEYHKAMKGQEELITHLDVIKNYKHKSKEEKANILDTLRIECYDISNIHGSNPVGSMVVFQGGSSIKAHYRKFKIYSKETPDDFQMMYEMLFRRFTYLKTDTLKFQPNIKRQEIKKNIDESFASRPDIVIIDGGKGQLKQGIKVFKELELNEDIFLCSLAKRREEIFVPEKKGSFVFDENSQALYLLQRIRDEAHRFGLNFHRKRRSKNMFT